MAVEIERKFLVKDYSWLTKVQRVRHVVMGYVAITPSSVTRVAIVQESHMSDRRAWMTIKGPGMLSRVEEEFLIPTDQAEAILNHLIQPGTSLIKKTRYKFTELNADNSIQWEIDVFDSPRPGLVLAEVELKREDQKLILPSWIGEEVTGNPKFYNQNLALGVEE